jgi:hypothetical protein
MGVSTAPLFLAHDRLRSPLCCATSVANGHSCAPDSLAPLCPNCPCPTPGQALPSDRPWQLSTVFVADLMLQAVDSSDGSALAKTAIAAPPLLPRPSVCPHWSQAACFHQGTRAWEYPQIIASTSRLNLSIPTSITKSKQAWSVSFRDRNSRPTCLQRKISSLAVVSQNRHGRMMLHLSFQQSRQFKARFVLSFVFSESPPLLCLCPTPH